MEKVKYCEKITRLDLEDIYEAIHQRFPELSRDFKPLGAFKNTVEDPEYPLGIRLNIGLMGLSENKRVVHFYYSPQSQSFHKSEDYDLNFLPDADLYENCRGGYIVRKRKCTKLEYFQVQPLWQIA